MASRFESGRGYFDTQSAIEDDVVVEPTIRPAVLDDAEQIARVHIASSDEAYAPLAGDWPIADLQRRVESWREWFSAPDISKRTLLVADAGTELVGFVGGGAARRQEPNAATEIYVIHVMPLRRGHGIGGQLWQAACAAIRGDARESMFVETLAELRCCSFYESHGGEVVERTPKGFHGATRTLVVYRWGRGIPHEAQT
jgi:ribosomal protein S18 acetylase RimI-like enzyme